MICSYSFRSSFLLCTAPKHIQPSVQAAIQTQKTVCKYLLAASAPGLSFRVLLGAKLTKAAHFGWKEECVGQQVAEIWANSFRRQVEAQVPTLLFPLKHLLLDRIRQIVLEEY